MVENDTAFFMVVTAGGAPVDALELPPPAVIFPKVVTTAAAILFRSVLLCVTTSLGRKAGPPILPVSDPPPPPVFSAAKGFPCTESLLLERAGLVVVLRQWKEKKR